MYDLKSFYGPNAGYVLEQYERYQQDPSSVDTATRAIFDTWPKVEPQFIGTLPLVDTRDVEAEIARTVAVSALAHAIRERGHLAAHLDPLGTTPPGDSALLLETFGISDDDLASLPPNVVGGHAAEGARNAREA